MARYRTIVIIASIGVFAGATLSNGMMDVARHGIMTPLYFSFYDVMCVFLAVMVTDVVLLDVFNTRHRQECRNRPRRHRNGLPHSRRRTDRYVHTSGVIQLFPNSFLWNGMTMPFRDYCNLMTL